MNKIEALNSLHIIDWSSSCGELEYVLAKNSEKNRQKLLNAGFTEEQIKESTDNNETEIDLSYLAFNYAGVDWWQKDTGFLVD